MLLLAPPIFLSLISNSFSVFEKPLSKMSDFAALVNHSPQLNKLTSFFSNLMLSPLGIGLIIFALFVLIVLFVVSIIIGITLQIGYIRIGIHAFDQSEDEPAWSVYNNFGKGIIGKYFWASLLLGLMILGGLILLIVPGIILSLMYQFVLFILVEKNLSINNALKISNYLTDGIKWQLFGYGLLQGFLTLLVLLPIMLLEKISFLYLPLNTIVTPIVGMFFTLAGIFIYKDIASQVANLTSESSENMELPEDKELE